MAEPSYLKNLIIAAIVVVVLLVFLKIFSNGVVPLTKDQVCEQSINANARGHIRGLTIDSEINCPTNIESIKSKTEPEKKKEIAERMEKCWTKFKMGKAELFSQNKIYCSICDVFEFEDKEKIVGFQSYIMETRIPNKDITYLDYFSGYETPRAEEILSNIDPAKLKEAQIAGLDSKKRYSVIFLYAKGEKEMEQALRHVSGQTTAGKAGAIGSGVVAGAAGLTAIGMLAVGSGPVGWVVLGIGTIAAVTGVEWVTYGLSSDNHPDWVSFIMLQEYNAQSLKELNCQEIK